MKTLSCPVCRCAEIESVLVGHAFIRHQDFLPMKKRPGEMHSCRACQTIFLRDEDVSSELDAMYRGPEYAQKRKSEHVVFASSGSQAAPRTTYSCMAELIAARAVGKGIGVGRFLDIGCFDGKLSVELGRLFPKAQLHGYDVSEHIGDIFPKDARYRYHTGDLKAIDGRFDLITIVNTLLYIPDLPGFMDAVGGMLAPGGAVFAINPNTSKNPFFLTCGDQYIYQTPANTRNFWRHFGYSVDLILDDPSFPRSIVAVARRAPGKAPAVGEADDTLARGLGYLAKAASELKAAVAAHKAGGGGRVVVLGATNNAAWAFHVLGKDLSAFADENPNRAGRKFYGLETLPPAVLTERDLLLVPYAESARALAEKIGRTCKARLVAL